MGKVKKNRLADVDLETARELTPRKKRRARRDPRKAAAHLGKSRLARDVRSGSRLPPPVPKNKSLSEMADMDPDDPAFKHPQGRPRERLNRPEEEDDNWRDVVRRAEQEQRRQRRAQIRKEEAMLAVAVQKLERHVSDTDRREKDIYDEDLAVAQGIVDLTGWTNEELVRGYKAGRNGKFGKAPRYIPREVQQAAFRILVNRGDMTLKKAYYESIEKLIQLAHGADSEKVKLDAIKELMNRVVGKVPDRVNIAHEEPWEGILADSMVPVGEGLPIDLEMGDDGVAALPAQVVDLTPDDIRSGVGVDAVPGPGAAPGHLPDRDEAPSAPPTPISRSEPEIVQEVTVIAPVTVVSRQEAG